MYEQQKETFFMNANWEPKAWKLWAIFGWAMVWLILFLSFIGAFYQIVPPSHRWVVVELWQLQDEVLLDWFHIKAPWVSILPVYIAPTSTDEGRNVWKFRWMNPLSKDWQEMEIDIQIEYSIIDPVKFRQETWWIDPIVIEDRLLATQVRRLIYDYTSEYTWKSLIQWGERQELWQRIFETISTWDKTKRVCKEESREIDEKTGIEKIKLAWCNIEKTTMTKFVEAYWVSVNTVNLRRVRPNAAIIQAVEDAQKKEQQVLIAIQDAEIERQKANKVIETKRWVTESQKLEAEASAYKLRVELEEKAEWTKAEALAMIEQAKAQRELNKALQGSKDLIEYKRLDVEMVHAEAMLEWAKHPERKVPTTITIIGTEEANSMKLLMWVPNVAVQE